MPKPEFSFRRAPRLARHSCRRELPSASAKSKEGANPVFQILAGDDIFAKMWPVLLKPILGPRHEIKSHLFKTDVELIQLTRQHRFDLICLYIGNIFWTRCFRSDVSPEPSQPWWEDMLPCIVATLSDIRHEFGKPVIATQAMDWQAEFSDTGVSFLPAPIDIRHFRRAVKI
jgi:hypothetical protein